MTVQQKIPNSPSSAWVIPGLRRSKRRLDTAISSKVAEYVAKAEAACGLEEGALKKRWEGSGRPKKIEDGISVSEVRKAIVWDLLIRTTISKKRLAGFIGVKDHSSVCFLEEKAKAHVDSNDAAFLFFYDRVKTIPI